MVFCLEEGYWGTRESPNVGYAFIALACRSVLQQQGFFVKLDKTVSDFVILHKIQHNSFPVCFRLIQYTSSSHYVVCISTWWLYSEQLVASEKKWLQGNLEAIVACFHNM